MLAEVDNEWSSGEESLEMGEVSETTPLVVSQDGGARSPALPPSSRPPDPTSSMDGETNASFSNKGADLTDDHDISGGVNHPTTSTAASDGDRDGDAQSPPQDIDGEPSQQKTTPFVVLLAAFAAIGGFLFGYDTGVVSGAMLLLRDEFSLSSLQQEAVVSVTIGGAFVAALFGGVVSDRFGRKTCTILASFVFTVGAVVLGFAQNLAMLIAGRLILGLGIGNEI